jgi:hypothetical protein
MEHKVLKVLKVQLDHKVQQVPKVYKVHKEQKEILEPKVLKATQVPKALKVL